MRIVVDAMGGDYAPYAVVEGVIDAIKDYQVNITLVGIEEQIKKELLKFTYDEKLIQIIHAPEVVDMHEPATTPIRKKKESSISVGINLIKDSNFDAFISAGNTAAVVAASTIFLGMLPEVERPAIGLVIPTLKDFAFLIDVGANANPKPEHLLQSALMARVYAREVLGVKDPTVGLINIGEEATKGTDFQKTTYKLMEVKIRKFMGNIEPNEIFKAKADCLICDGVMGNIIIKISEGLMEGAATLLKREIKKSPFAILGTFLMKSRLKHIRKLADYTEYGGAPLLGVNGLVMIGHGRSSPKAIKSAIRATIREVEHNIIAAIEKEISDKNE